MIARRLGNKWETVDPNTLLLLHGEDFTDSSASGYSISNNGITLDSGGKFDNALCFNGTTSQCLTFAPGSNLSGITDFTIDFWYKRTGVCTNGGIFCSNNYTPFWTSLPGGFQIASAANDIGMGITSSASSYTTYGNGYVIETNVWKHIAFSRQTGNLRLFIDGSLVNSWEDSRTLNSAGLCYLGRHDGRSNVSALILRANIDEFRVSNVARWTGNFTPPTAPYTK